MVMPVPESLLDSSLSSVEESDELEEFRLGFFSLLVFVFLEWRFYKKRPDYYLLKKRSALFYTKYAIAVSNLEEYKNLLFLQILNTKQNYHSGKDIILKVGSHG